jgi:thiaminase
MESDINFLLEGMRKAAKIPKSLRNVKLDIKREKELNKWVEKYRSKEFNEWLESLKKSIN